MTKDKNCVFCKVLDGMIPAPRLWEDERFFCIRDIKPQAKVHLLVISKEHIVSLEDAPQQLMNEFLSAAVKVAREQKVLPHGFRTIINTGEGGGQTVPHLHLHILGGEKLGERFN